MSLQGFNPYQFYRGGGTPPRSWLLFGWTALRSLTAEQTLMLQYLLGNHYVQKFSYFIAYERYRVPPPPWGPPRCKSRDLLPSFQMHREVIF